MAHGKIGVTRSQITFEEHGVDGFSISPKDGIMALVSENKLHLLHPERQTHALIADGNMNFDPDHFSYTSMISKPSFSPAEKPWHMHGTASTCMIYPRTLITISCPISPS